MYDPIPPTLPVSAPSLKESEPIAVPPSPPSLDVPPLLPEPVPSPLPLP